MIYKDFKNLKLSALGLGAMRFPTIKDESTNRTYIDKKRTKEMIDYAISRGINYFDTAYIYHNGQSEVVLGEILSEYPRESYYLADKFPGFDLSNMDKVEEIFETQLKRCKTDYFDFYLFHNVNEDNINQYLDEDKYGIMPYLLKQKAKGRIRHLGFSTHSKHDAFNRMLDTYGDSLEFCQLQLNYLDWTYQDARSKVELLNKLNIPIWVMEPLRGGKLAKLPQKATSMLNELRPNESIPAWAFRFLQSIDGVTVTLSGMSTLEQIKENISTFEKDIPLNQEEMSSLFSIADRLSKIGIIPCTSCRYCTSKCPKQLDIPKLLNIYSDIRFAEEKANDALSDFLEEKKPTACISCHNCETVCPQKIKIADAFADFASMI